MGSSGDNNKKAIDESVGGLVWVRRQNGSWWPGRILRLDELPETTLPVPRTGTPIKLLGREDASLDWYNLETSKRVKAFRCGEFDDFIEQAKATASILSKKAGKYARREDAIIQALELESACIRKQGGVLEEYHISEDSTEESEDFEEDSTSSEDESYSAQDMSTSVVSFEEPDHVVPPNGPYTPSRPSYDMEDDRMVLWRMRGLSDLGVDQMSTPRRKRSEVARVQEYLKRKQKEIEKENVERFFNMSLIAKEKHSSGSSAMISSASQKAHVFGGAQSSQSSLVETLSFGNEELNESGSFCSVTADIHNVGQGIGKGAADWLLKGKRTSRPRRTDVDNNSLDMYMSCTSLFGKLGSIAENKVEHFPRWFGGVPQMKPRTETQAAELTFPQRTLPYRQSRSNINPKYDASDFYLEDPRFDSSLYDVDLEVKSNYRPQSVPYISLMSKLTGQPVIGHPLTVDILEGRSCDNLNRSSELYYHDLSNEASVFQSSNVVIKRGRGRPRTRNVALQQPILPKKSQKLKWHGGSSKKTRKLSSLTGSSEDDEVSEEGPVIEKFTAAPVVACIPLKVVFSRLNEALN